MLKPVVARYQGKVSGIYFRADAAFAMPEVYEFLRIKYAIRLPANQVLRSQTPVGRSGTIHPLASGLPTSSENAYHPWFIWGIPVQALRSYQGWQNSHCL